MLRRAEVKLDTCAQLFEAGSYTSAEAVVRGGSLVPLCPPKTLSLPRGIGLVQPVQRATATILLREEVKLGPCAQLSEAGS